MNNLYFKPKGVWKVLLIGFAMHFSLWVRAQVNTGGTATTADHNKQIVGYITNWDAWKAANAGLPAQGALTHLNIDYSKYTILNYSFFGVAVDGSLHSGDLRNKNIYQEGTIQEPGDIFYTDIYSSWDMHILFGEIDPIQYISEDAAERAIDQGFEVEINGTTWTQPTWGLSGSLPIPLHNEDGAPGLLELAHENGVKVLASIGGWSMCKHFPEMAADPIKRALFIADCQKLINTGFDGIDLDWEYPGPYSGMNFTGTTADYANFLTLVQEIRSAIGPDKLITAAFSADPVKLQGFDWASLSTSMDYFNMMTYDFNGGFSDIAGHNSPIYSYDGAEAPTFNWQSTYEVLTTLGVPTSKINFGVPFYGRGVVTDGDADLNAPTLKRQETVQPDGPITTSADFTNWPRDVYDGTPNYFYIKQQALGAGSGWTRYWDDQAKVPYLVKDDYFLSYDDVESIGLKGDYIVDHNLAGAIVWTVYGDLEISGTATSFGAKLKRWSSVDSELINTLNEHFATEGTGGNSNPTTSITSPTDGTSFEEGEDVVITASASDSDGTIISVEFYADSDLIGAATSSPYTTSWSAPASGAYVLKSKAIDNVDGSSFSTAINITVGTVENVAPIISITSPADGQTFSSGASITFSVSASDSDGSISKVAFYENESLLGEDSTSPYSYEYTNGNPGEYLLSAIAYDNLGAISEASVSMTVVEGAGNGDCNGIYQYVENGGYSAGSQVYNEGGIYQCKEYPYSGWCNGSAWAYAPGTGDYWADAWNFIETCENGDDNETDTNTPPTISFSSNLSGSDFEEGSPIVIDAEASDDGSIVTVEFYANGTKLGEDTSAPYSFTWSNATVGSHSLTLVATDDEASSTTSSEILITVVAVDDDENDDCSSGFRIVGYMPSWSGSADDIPYEKLTHIIYAFIRPTTSGGLTTIEDATKLQSIVAQAHAQGIKVSIAVGGWSDLNNADFEGMAATATGRTAFASNLLSLCNQYDLDGVDIDWEYPREGTTPDDYLAMMQVLSETLHTNGKILTAAVSAQGYYADGILTGVFQEVDFLNLMVYDGGSGADHSPYSYAVSSLDYWIGRGLPASKAVLGVPFYARPSWSSFATLVSQGADPYADTYNGDYYNGITTIQQKTALAENEASGIMIWELSQDVLDNTYLSLLNAIFEVAPINCNTSGAPSVYFTNPLNGATIETGVPITLAATATDDSNVTSVIFEINGQSYSSSASGNVYTATWIPSADGTYTLSVTVVDDENNSTTQQILISASDMTCTAAAWEATVIYYQGDQVSQDGIRYEAKWWTQNEDPSTHSADWDVWENLGTCGSTSRVAQSVTKSFTYSTSTFPNPFQDSFSLKIQIEQEAATKILIYNTAGQQVYQQNLGILSKGSHNHSINTSVLVTGIYYVHLQIGESTEILKLIKN